MRSTDDLWYIRLPSGHIIRAKTTRALRYHLQSGRVPWTSWVRRSSTDDWTTLDWVPEVADLQKSMTRAKSPEAARHNTTEQAYAHVPLPQGQALGVRGLIGELLSALEGSLNQSQLLCGAAMGLAVGIGLATSALLSRLVEAPLTHWILAGVWLLLSALILMGSLLLTRMRVLEIARMRPAHTSEVRRGQLWKSGQLWLVHLLTTGVVVGVLVVLPRLYDGFPHAGERSLPEGLAAVLTASRLVLEVSCWPLLILTLMLAPILVVEESGIFGTIRRWLGVLRVHMGRLLVYESLTLVVAIVLMLPFLAPVAFAAWQSGTEVGLAALVREGLLWLFTGLALTPLLTYLTVANVNIYLNVQYELYQSQRSSGQTQS